MEWRTDPPPRKENEFILAIFKGKPYPYVVFWSSMWDKGAWIFVAYDYIEEDPIYWMPITMPQRRPE